MNRKRLLIWLSGFLAGLIIITVFYFLFFNTKFNKETGRENQKELPVESISSPPNQETVEHDESFMEEFNQTQGKTKYSFILSDGREVSIYLPGGINPPPLNVVEELQKQLKDAKSKRGY